MAVVLEAVNSKHIFFQLLTKCPSPDEVQERCRAYGELLLVLFIEKKRIHHGLLSRCLQ